MVQLPAVRKTRPYKYNDIFYTIPAKWSDNAGEIFIAKYCRSYTPKDVRRKRIQGFAERTVEQTFIRLVRCWFPRDKQLQDKLLDDLWNQVASPNSPQYFNAGIYNQYQVKGDDIGLWRIDNLRTVPSLNTYEYPQLHACFIQTVEDSIEGIYELVKKEARLFSRGSGTGSNFSPLRGKDEKLSSGGWSSGLLPFLKVFDVSAGAIKSGGTTRRAAKMVVLDIDHPDIEMFINWKWQEEQKARILIKHSKNKPDHRDWENDAYQTVSGQNSNNSISIPDKFFDAVDQDEVWELKGRCDDSVNRIVSAKHLWDQICEAAWYCADPGVQFYDTINQWNTTPKIGKIVASNPCSEHLRLNDSACNLASINLCSFLVDDDRVFDLDQFEDTCRRWTKVLNRSIDIAGYPSKRIAEGTIACRDIGLGYCNLGSLLMQLGLPYDSEASRFISAILTSIMTASAYCQSAELASSDGQYPAYEATAHQRIANRHADEFYNLRNTTIGLQYLQSILQDRFDHLNKFFQLARDRASILWQTATQLTRTHGLRNAQLTVIAPTGTIGITMDADTTGIEPVFALSAIKTLSGGGFLKQVSNSAVKAFKTLGYSQDTINRAEQAIISAGSLKQQKDILTHHKMVFQTAIGDNSLDPIAHVKMLAAVQPFVSGGISKTVNLPATATVDDIDRIYRLAHKSGVKCIAVYRDGSKTQPLTQECPTCGDDEVCELSD